MNKQRFIKAILTDILIAVFAGMVVGTAYHFFQNSNGFAPGGVGGLATITHYFLEGKVSWTLLMLAFNLPIFIILAAYVDRRLGFILTVYMFVQSFMPKLYDAFGVLPYSLATSGEDFNVIFAAIVTGVVSGFGFSMMLRRFGASGGTYGISAIIKKAKPATNIAYVSFIMDASVVFIAFFVYGMKVSPVVCTLLNLFIANVIVDRGLSGMKDGYKFELITDAPEELASILMKELRHGVTELKVHGMYGDADHYMLICVINKRQVGQMMKIIKAHPGTFATFTKINEVFGNFKRKV